VWIPFGVAFSNTVWWDVFMELSDFWEPLSAGAKLDFAKRCETSVGHISNIAFWGKRCGEKLAVCIERETKGQVRCESLRADVDWAVLRASDPVVGSKRPFRAANRKSA
jgi:DNA-binding transcriptional regulator YdaS (Cro superfamily)